MTMTQKIHSARKKSKSKNGFTLVELVIVIAILAVLAAVAIPVITSSINSARLSVMKSDTATLNMVIKECVNTSKAFIQTSKYNGKTADSATIEDVCIENNIGQGNNNKVSDDSFFKRNIGGYSYEVIYTIQGNVEISGGENHVPASEIKLRITKDISIKSLDPL